MKTYTKKEIVEKVTEYFWERSNIYTSYDYDELQKMVAEALDTEINNVLIEWNENDGATKY